MHIKLNFDGAVTESRLKTDMGVGVAVFVDGVYVEDLSVHAFFPGTEYSSSNVAEWLGCVSAMKLLCEIYEPGDKIEVFSDSQIISRQFNGEYAINKPEFKPFYEEAKEWVKRAGLENLKITWVKREFNKEADRLSKMGLRLKEASHVSQVG